VSARLVDLRACAGLVGAPLAWAANMQWGQVAPYLDCRSGLHANVAASLAAAAIALACAALSWRAPARTGPKGPTYPASYRFVSQLAALAGLLFAYALLLQAASGLWLSGCER
jgi:hypothetical protein